MSTPLITSDLPPLRILVVDDESSIRMVAQRMCERLGHTAVAVASSAAALEAAAAPVAPQLALIDMRLGEEDGLQLANSIRLLLPEAPIIIMGGDLGEAARRTQVQGTRVHLLAKPFAFPELNDALRRAAQDLPVSGSRDGDSCMTRADNANIVRTNGQ